MNVGRKSFDASEEEGSTGLHPDSTGRCVINSVNEMSVFVIVPLTISFIVRVSQASRYGVSHIVWEEENSKTPRRGSMTLFKVVSKFNDLVRPLD